MLHKVRDLLVRQRTMLINALRGHLAEFGFVAAQGPAGVKAVIAEFHADQNTLPELARSAIRRLIGRIEEVAGEVRKAEAEIVAWCRKRCRQPPPPDDPRYRANHRERDLGGRTRSNLISLRPTVCGLARAHAAAAQQRRQGAAWPNQ